MTCALPDRPGRAEVLPTGMRGVLSGRSVSLLPSGRPEQCPPGNRPARPRRPAARPPTRPATHRPHPGVVLTIPRPLGSCSTGASAFHRCFRAVDLRGAPHVPARSPPPGRRHRHGGHRHRQSSARAQSPCGAGRTGRRRRRGRGPAGRLPGAGGRPGRRVRLDGRHAGRRTPGPGADRHPAGAAPRADRGRAEGGRLGAVREAAVPVAGRTGRRHRRRGGLRRLRLGRLPAPLRLRRRPRPRPDHPRRAGRPAGRALPDHLAPGRRLLRPALARPVGHRGRRAHHGARHPPVRPAAAPARRVGGDTGHGGPAGPRHRERGRLHRPGPLPRRRARHRRQQRALPGRGEPHPHRLRRRHGGADPPVRARQRRLGLHPGPARPSRARRRLAHPRRGRPQFAHRPARCRPRRLRPRCTAPGSGQDARAALDFAAALYKAAFTGQPVRAGEIGPGDPYYTAMHGGHPDWAPKERA